MSNYVFYKIKKEKLSELLPIFQDAFGLVPTLDNLKNKHRTDFTGCSEIGYVAYDEFNIPVAFYGVFPLYVVSSGKKILICQSGDTMVKNQHSGRGLFTQLAKKTYTLCKNKKIKAVFGFPSYTSYYGFVKNLDWIHKENLCKFQFFIFTYPLAFLLYKFNFLTKIHFKFVKFILNFFPSGKIFNSSTSVNNDDVVYRDKFFWQYKLLNKDVFLIKISNCDVALKINKYIEIGDINYKSSKDLKKIIRNIQLVGFILGINIIRFYCSPSCRIEKDLKFIKSPSKGLPIGYRSFSSDCDISKVKYTYLDMDTF